MNMFRWTTRQPCNARPVKVAGAPYCHFHPCLAQVVQPLLLGRSDPAALALEFGCNQFCVTHQDQIREPCRAVHARPTKVISPASVVAEVEYSLPERFFSDVVMIISRNHG